MAHLLFAGALGIFWLWQIQGLAIGPTISYSHWYLMVFGFFGALIGGELLYILSLEWSRRYAPARYGVPFLASIWASTVLLLAGAINSEPAFFQAAALASAAAMASVALYSAKTYLKPSAVFFRPTATNYMVVASAALAALLPLAHVFLGLNPAASLLYPVAMIFAILTRDIALITGEKPKPKISAASFAPWALITAGYLAYQASPLASGVMLLAAAIWALIQSGLIAVWKRGRNKWSIFCLYTAFLWLATSAVFMTASQGLYARDAAIHAAALGFIFNVIFGVDVVLMEWLYIAAGVTTPPKRSRRLLALPYLLLNAGLVLRILYDAGAIQGAAAYPSGPLTGLGVVSFFLINLSTIVAGRRRARGVSARAVGAPALSPASEAPR